MDIDKNEMLLAMQHCAVWTGIDEDGDPFDCDKYADTEWEPSATKTMGEWIDTFIERAPADALDRFREVYDDGQIGHDLWLTLGRFGVGFYDRAGISEEDGDALYNSAKFLSYERNVFLTDSGKFDIE